ncbi:MAG: ABC transporter ATP-binding protein [Oscillospiraceae bacterium]|jgi:ABC-2 type transport system ATP-binding protein|nr:ABC transporter ATP-binding protein [Oscillospiraceae bacterium]
MHLIVVNVGVFRRAVTNFIFSPEQTLNGVLELVLNGGKPMIEVQKLTKRYGSNLALDDVSFSVKEGEVLGFLGPNGAGKSTTMNILTGYLSLSSGSVKIAGFDVLTDSMKAKENIGYLPEIPPLYPEMTVNSYLKFIFGIKKSKLPREKHIGEIVKKLGLDDVSGKVIRNLSKGYKQRVGLAGALIGDPKILILDEPTVGLDPQQIIEIRNLIESLKANHTVIFSSHILSEVQSLCDRVLVINKGKIIADDAPGDLSKQLESNQILFALIEGEKTSVVNLVNSIAGVSAVEAIKEAERSVFEYKIQTSSKDDIRRKLFFALSEAKMPLLGLRSCNFSLEEVFLKLVKDQESQENELKGQEPKEDESKKHQPQENK